MSLSFYCLYDVIVTCEEGLVEILRDLSCDSHWEFYILSRWVHTQTMMMFASLCGLEMSHWVKSSRGKVSK